MALPAQVWLLAGLLVAAKLADPPEESPSQARERRRREREVQNPAKPLYHVTGLARAALIRKEGFVPGQIVSESAGMAEAAARAELTGEELDWYEDELSDEERAREAFDSFMDDAWREARQKDPNVPQHTDSIFFWDDKQAAVDARRTVSWNTGEPWTILEVDPTKIPCRCYQADKGVSDDLFDTVMADLDAAEACAGITGYGDEEELDCDKFDKIAKRYYRTVKPWDGRSNYDDEVMCPCEIPPDAIVRES